MSEQAPQKGEYETQWRASLDDPEAFWLARGQAVDWHTAADRALESQPPFHRWYPDGELNVCRERAGPARRRRPRRPRCPDLRLPRHRHDAHLHLCAAARRGGARSPACWPGSVSGAATAWSSTCRWCPRPPWRCSRARGSARCTRWCSAASRRASSRSGSTTPTPVVVVSASCGIEGKRVIEYKPLLDQAIELAEHKPGKRVILQRPQAQAEMGPDDVDWAEAMATRRSRRAAYRFAATDPLYILYTSGTTGKPKGVVRDGGGYAVALAWTMANIYDVGPGETMFTASDVGWVVGHSYIVYAPLLVGATTVLYEGKPVGHAGRRAVLARDRRARRETMFTAPTAFRAIKKEDPKGALLGGYDLSRPALPLPRRRAAGPRDLPVGLGPARHPRDRPLVADRDGVADLREPDGPRAAADQAGLADEADARLGRARSSTPRGEPVATRRGRRDRHQAAAAARVRCRRCGTTTSASCGRTCRPSTATTSPATAGRIDDDGYVYVMGRTDDVINVAGHRLSTGGMEEALASHPDVAECAVIGVADPMKGQVPRGFVVLKAGVQPDEDELRCRAGRARARADRRGGVAAGRRRGAGAAEDPLGQDPSSNDARDRRRCGRAGAVDDRRPRRPRRPAPGAAADWPVGRLLPHFGAKRGFGEPVNSSMAPKCGETGRRPWPRSLSADSRRPDR